MKRYIANLLCPAAALFATLAMAGEPARVRMATTTSTENSGLFKVIQPVFEQVPGIRVHVIAVGTGKKLNRGGAELPT